MPHPPSHTPAPPFENPTTKVLISESALQSALPGFATPEGTYRPGRKLLGNTGLWVSPFGFGSLRWKSKHPDQTESFRLALLKGCNLVDSGHRAGTAREIREAWETSRGAPLTRKDRESLILCVEIRSSAAAEGWPSAEGLRTEIEELGQAWGVETLDFVLIPLSTPLSKSPLEWESILEGWIRTCRTLEALREEGKIRHYGIRSPFLSREIEAIPPLPAWIERFEEQVGLIQEKGWSVLSIPFNLIECEGALLPIDSRGHSLLEVAESKGLAVVGYRSLHGVTSAGVISLRSFPKRNLDEILAVLERNASTLEALERERPEGFPAYSHQIRQAGSLFRDPAPWKEALQEKILPSLENWRDRLSLPRESEDETESALRDLAWFAQYSATLSEFLSGITQLTETSAQLRSERLAEVMGAPGENIRDLALAALETTPGLSCSLLGLRTPLQVEKTFIERPRRPHSFWAQAYEKLFRDRGNSPEGVPAP